MILSGSAVPKNGRWLGAPSITGAGEVKSEPVSNPFRVEVVRGYAAGEWLGSRSLAPRWLE
jgi:hypothetical protein